ncbi:hypothetical protein D9756_005029 [Leucocoprinus leucothites]|uniref:SET domain-containing protein n=1 Tax=Leucocoprinus leucothites TaxID=201217 RepID=A0A8H5G8W0_9AGAR|nr:hypothetical protein D9756_005029 [Leucoagaricus leucothites]
MSNYSIPNVELTSHPAARSQARATQAISAGSIIISVPAFAFALLDAEKGQRCDVCFRRSHETRHLKKCTGCASYYYCDADCQMVHWNMEHKRICRIYNKMDALVGSRQLAQHERMDVLLLSHFLARIGPRAPTDSDKATSGDDEPLSTFVSLLPGPNSPSQIVDMIPRSLNRQQELTRKIYARFHNNNFTVHSHMTTIGHGVFPLASRLFNHSCMPNAAPRYILTPAKPPLMEVVALRDIDIGEEVCVPYLDPALTQARHQIFQYTYGFICECNSCTALRSLSPIPEVPQSQDAVVTIGEALRHYAGMEKTLGQALPAPSLVNLPVTLRCALHESYMEQLSGQFSKAAHEGQYSIAIESGATLLVLYLLIYPRNYPQIGLHLLELAKTRWNALISSAAPSEAAEAEAQVRVTLSHARQILAVYGREGDENGPLDELQNLEGLLDE